MVLEIDVTNYSDVQDYLPYQVPIDFSFVFVAVYISTIKIIFPDTYLELSRSRLNYDQLIAETDLDKPDLKDKLDRLHWELKYSMATDQEAGELLEKSERNWRDDLFWGDRNFVATACSILDTFSEK